MDSQIDLNTYEHLQFSAVQQKSPTTKESSEHWPSDFGRSVFAINHFTGTKIWPTLHNHLPLEEAGYSCDESSVYSLEIQEDSEEEDDDLSESEVNDWFRPIPENPIMPLQIQNWQGREGAIQLCSFEAVENKAFICDECGIHEDGSVPTIWREFPQCHKDNLTYHKECFISILRKATKDKNVARWVEDEFLATKLKNIKAGKKEDTKVTRLTTVTVSKPMIEQLSEAEPVIQQLSDTKAENQSLKQLGFSSLEDLGASDESAMKGNDLANQVICVVRVCGIQSVRSVIQ